MTTLFSLSKPHLSSYDPLQCVVNTYKLSFYFVQNGYISLGTNSTDSVAVGYKKNVLKYTSSGQLTDPSEKYIWIPATGQIRHETQPLVWTVGTYNNQYYVFLDTPSLGFTNQVFTMSGGSSGYVITTIYNNTTYYLNERSGYVGLISSNPKSITANTDGKYYSSFIIRDSNNNNFIGYSLVDDPLYSISFTSSNGYITCQYDKTKITNWSKLNMIVSFNFSQWDTPSKRNNEPNYQDIVNGICADTNLTPNPLDSTLPCVPVCTASKKCNGLNSYCVNNMVNWGIDDATFNSCRTYMSANQYTNNILNPDIQQTFKTECNLVYTSLKSKRTLSNYDKSRLDKCSCYPNQDMINSYKAAIRSELTDTAANLLTSNGPVKCWYPNCNQNTTGLSEPDRNTCPNTQLQFCVNKVQINNSGNINSLNLKQDNSCRQYLNTGSGTIDTSLLEATPPSTTPPTQPNSPPPSLGGSGNTGFSSYTIWGGAFVIITLVVIVLQSMGIIVLWKKNTSLTQV